MAESANTSPFLNPGKASANSSLAFLYLSRDNTIATILRDRDDEDSGYAEGSVATTRFGSFPHSTLLDQPWGSQIIASNVDTGSRGKKSNKKRKIEKANGGGGDAPAVQEQGEHPSNSAKELKAAVAASSGFCHILNPTPELWTSSLPHRTQVVYTPDYSFILQKMQVRPSSVLIEAGAGSGSFTHAAARAVFSGYPPAHNDKSGGTKKTHKRRRYGKVFSFEYHEQRAAQLRIEITEHGLDGIVHITHQDVCEDGFLVPSSQPGTSTDGKPSEEATSPCATHVFLDLPCPWLAIPHLTRRTSNGCTSPLSADHPVHLTAFQPCIEQAQRTISSLRQHGWVEISMQELAHRRIEVRRERVGLANEGLRGVNAGPADVDEALGRLRQVAKNSRAAQAAMAAKARSGRGDGDGDGGDASEQYRTPPEPVLDGAGEQTTPSGREDAPGRESRAARLARIAREAASRKTYKEGRLVHRTEPEIKTHTSYLVFAILPRDWTEEDEEAARKKYGA